MIIMIQAFFTRLTVRSLDTVDDALEPQPELFTRLYLVEMSETFLINKEV